MAGGTADALEEAQAEKQKIYQRMTEVRGLVDTALDSAERMRQTQRLKILRDMYRDACDRVERLRPAQSKKRKTVTRTVKSGGVTWDFFERSGAVWSDLEGFAWNTLGKLAEDADAHGARLLAELIARGQTTLTDRQRYYIGRCFGEQKTVAQVAEEDGVHRSTVSRVVRAGLQRLENAVVSSLYALECIEGDTFDHLRWAAATAALTERQRECLYYLLSQDASLGMIAGALRVHKSTISRANERIVERLTRAGPSLPGLRPRRVVHRSDWRGRSEDEIAAMLGISKGTYYRCVCRNRPVGGISRFAYECLVRRHMDVRDAAADLGCRPATVRKYWERYADVDVSKLDTPPAYAPAEIPGREQVDVRRLLSSAAPKDGTIGAAVSGETYRKMLRMSGAERTEPCRKP